MKKTLILASALAFIPSMLQASEAAHVEGQEWSFSGMFGTYDQAALQRGYKVYREVCAACHSMKRVYFRNLEALGYDEGQVKTIASGYTVTDGPNDEGEMFDRPGLPSDHFPSPYPNDNAAKSVNNGALPPDLSLITKARHGGADYIYGILTGYEGEPEAAATSPAPAAEASEEAAAAPVETSDADAVSEAAAPEAENAEDPGSKHGNEAGMVPMTVHGITLLPGQHYNKTMPGHIIAMPPPLSNDMIMYEDQTPQTVEQYSKDVSHFLTWAADPYMEDRKRTGIKVIIFLAVFTLIMYRVKRKIWSKIH